MAEYIVSSGENCNGVILNNYDSMTVLDGGIATTTTVNSGGSLYVSSGGMATNIIWTPCIGMVTASDGAYVTYASQYSGVYFGSAGQLLSHTSVLDGKTIGSSCEMIVMSGGTANNANMVMDAFDISYYENAAIMNLFSGGVANNTKVFSFCCLNVYSGGMAENTTLHCAGDMYVYSGGITNNTRVNSRGYFKVFSGGTANGVKVYSGYLKVSSGGTATDILWTPCEGTVHIEHGAVATFVSQYSGVYFGSADQLLSNASVMNGKTIGSDTELCIMSGGIANDTMVYKNGLMNVSSGGVANSAMLYEEGEIKVWAGGTANYTTIDSGYLYVSSFATANYTTINGGWADLEGTVNNTTVNGGVVGIESAANYTTINSGGCVYIYDGGSANNVTVNIDANLDIFSGGTANGATVNSGGYLYISSDGKVTGKMTLEKGAVVSMAEDAILDFDLTQVESGAEAFVNDLSIIQGTPLYTLTVNDDLKPGSYVYTLADGAPAFNSTISVVNKADDELGVLTVGETVRIGENDYTLSLADSALSVTVEVQDVTAPVITLSADTETVVLQTTLTATVDDGSKIHYRIGEFGAWKEYKEPIIASLNETYYFMAADEAGNIGTNQITFGNIDTSGVLLSTLWAQKGICPMGGNTTIMYNEYTPYDPTVTPDTHSRTGCVNTAAGQLIYYFIEKKGFDLALTLTEEDEYTSKHKANDEGGEKIVIEIKADGTTPGTLSFAEINAMLSDFQLDSAEHAAALVYACGVVLKSKYAAASTGTSWNEKVFRRSGFKSVSTGGPFYGDYYWGTVDSDMNCYVSDAGYEVLIENLENGRPVGVSIPGHALVIDGYDRATDSFHINYGWDENVATRWYTRDETQKLNFEDFVYDLNPEYVETFTVTDDRVYGTGTMIRAFEQAAGMSGANTVAFDACVAGKTVELLNRITFLNQAVTVDGFNMNVLVTKSQASKPEGYGFYADSYADIDGSAGTTDLTFHATGGALIVSTEKDSNYAFQMQDGLSCTVDADGMLIYAGKPSDGSGAAAVLEALQTCRSENTQVSDDLLDPNGWSYNGSAGDDVFSLDNSSIAVGNVSLGGGGNDFVSIAGNSRLYGDIIAGDGNGSITIDSTSSVSGNLSGKCNLNFVLTERNDHALFTIKSSVSELCANAALSVNMTNAEVGTYTLISAAPDAPDISDLQKLAVTVTGNRVPAFTLSANGNSFGDYADLIYEDNSLKLQIKAESGSLPVSDVAPQTQTWEKVEEASQYIVEYSTDHFEHVIRLIVDSNSLNAFRMPAGSYQMRVKADDGEEWTAMEPVVAEEANEKSKFIKSDVDGNADVFFANASDTWESGYAAKHTGSRGGWAGTGETVILSGKNKLADIIEGSTDANILLMTDDSNGDGLFVDDIYTALPGTVTEQQARIAQINEIRAGAGNDIVDMTSQRFEYTGDGLTIRGGDGSDVIWANKGDNMLFGDDGNDRIVGASGSDVIVGGIGNDSLHGGGSDDVFAFCDNWGVDTVEQLESGTITLWFANGDESNWNAETLTYADGENRVTVSGVSAEQITLKFGNDGSEQFAALSNTGAFDAFTSRRIFEESDSGILAGV